MSFDPVTYSKVNKLIMQVGDAKQVIHGSSQPEFLDTGSVFDATSFPELAAMLPSYHQGDFYTKQTIPSISPSTILTTISPICNFTYTVGGVIYFLYVTGNETSAMHLFRATDPLDLTQGLTYVRRVPLPNINMNATNCKFSLTGNYVYISSNLTSDAHYRYHVTTDPTLTTPIAVSITGAGTSYPFSFVTNGTVLIANSGSLSVANRTFASTDDGVTWTPANTVAGMSSVYNIATNGTYFIAVSFSTATANIAKSTDGIEWTGYLVGSNGHSNVKWNSTYNLWQTTPINSGSFYSSPDGTTWTARGNATSSQVYFDISSSGAAISVRNNLMYTSPSGGAFTARYGSTPFLASTIYTNISALVCVDNTFVAFVAGATSYAQLYTTTSTDGGVTWSAAVPVAPVNDIQTTRYTPPVISSSGDKIIMMEAVITTTTSPVLTNNWRGLLSVDDGINWSPINIESIDGITWIKIVPTNDNKFIAVGNAVGSKGITASSSDGINWTVGSIWTYSATDLVVNASNVAMIFNSTTSYAGFSADYGSTWYSTTSLSGLTNAKPGVIGNTFVACMSAALTKFYIPEHNPYWTSCNQAIVTGSTVSCVISNDSYIVAFITGSDIYLYSNDGVSWAQGKLSFPITATSGGYINGWWIVPTGYGRVLRSRDLSFWETAPIGETTSEHIGKQLDTITFNSTTTYISGINISEHDAYILRSTDSGTQRRIPLVPNTTPNLKWVVKAKFE